LGQSWISNTLEAGRRKGKKMASRRGKRSHFRAMECRWDAIRHSKIVNRRQACDLTRHASDLAKLPSEVKYPPTHKRAI
jgi:hypothetical protein